MSSSDDNTARVWDTTTGKQIREIHGESLVQCVAWSADGEFIVSGSEDNVVGVWSVNVEVCIM